MTERRKLCGEDEMEEEEMKGSLVKLLLDE